MCFFIYKDFWQLTVGEINESTHSQASICKWDMGPGSRVDFIRIPWQSYRGEMRAYLIKCQGARHWIILQKAEYTPHMDRELHI